MPDKIEVRHNENEPLSIEKAHNLNKEKRENVRENASKREMPDANVYDADIVKRQLLAIVDNFIPDVGEHKMIRVYMRMRINGASQIDFARAFKVPIGVVKKFEEIGLNLMKKGADQYGAYRM